MNKQDLNKIAVALIEKYGLETGAELLTQLIQELNKPAQNQIANTPTPYYTTPYIPPTGGADQFKWARDITISSAK